MNKIEKIKTNVPSYFRPGVNVQWKALLEAHGEADERIVQQITEAKKQIFVETAERGYLDALGDNVGVFRPLEVNLIDDKYRKLIEFLSFYPKQVRSLVANVLDVFYDQTFLRFNVQTANASPFALFGGESLVFRKENDTTNTVTKTLTADGEVDGVNTVRVASTSGMYVGQIISVSDDNSQTITGVVTNLTNTIVTLDVSTLQFTTAQNAIIFFETYQYVNFQASDFATPGSATAEEVTNAINAIGVGVTASYVTTGNVNIMTNTIGALGGIQILGGTANDVLLFPTNAGQKLRIQINELNPNELAITIPSTVPSLRRTLKGCLHFHSSSAITSGYPSSYLYSPSAVNYTPQNKVTTLNQTITAGQVYTQLSVINSSSIPNAPGNLIINFGKENLEQPVPYIGRPNNSTILLDPSYVFTKDHSSGELINTILTEATTPRVSGGDYAVYNVGIDKARIQIQEIVRNIVATGVVIRWIINFPVCGKP